jgi:hypothetical protein
MNLIADVGELIGQNALRANAEGTIRLAENHNLVI